MSERNLSYVIDATPAGEPTTLLQVALEYTSLDPHAVHLQFFNDGWPTVSYRFARCLITEGLARPAGEGDVKVGPHPDQDGQVAIALREADDDGYPFEIHASREDLTDFIEQTYLLVPAGEEVPVDVDAELAALLRGGA